MYRAELKRWYFCVFKIFSTTRSKKIMTSQVHWVFSNWYNGPSVLKLWVKEEVFKRKFWKSRNQKLKSWRWRNDFKCWRLSVSLRLCSSSSTLHFGWEYFIFYYDLLLLLLLLFFFFFLLLFFCWCYENSF